MLAIGNENLTSTARAEIVQMTSAKMLSYCKYPTTLQYEVVASKSVNRLLKGKGDSISKWLCECTSKLCYLFHTNL